MIFSQWDKIGFVHIPKTGGTSITAALAGALTNSVVFQYDFKHHPLLWWRDQVLRTEFYKIQWLAVRRDPVEILTSFYAHTQYFAKQEAIGTTIDWKKEMALAAGLSFDDYLKTWLKKGKLKKGGFLKTYICDEFGNRFPNVDVIDFCNLNEGFAEFCSSKGLECVLPHENPSQAAKPAISGKALRWIREYCYADIS